MQDIERRTIIEYLKSVDPQEYANVSGMSLSDLIDTLIDYTTELELEHSILNTAFATGVNPDRYDAFYDSVMRQYETVREGDEIPTPVLDKLAAQYR